MLQKDDFVQIEYEGRSNGKLFDTSNAELAKKEGLNGEFTPLELCIGRNYVVKGLDESLIGKKEGDEFEVEISPEKGYGNWESQRVKVFSLKDLIANKINPIPGLYINMGGVIGMVRSVTSGRVRMDFNHPLAGKTLDYKVRITKIINDAKEKINILLNARLRIKNPEITQEGEKYIIAVKEKLPEQLIKAAEKEMADLKINAEFKKEKTETTPEKEKKE